MTPQEAFDAVRLLWRADYLMRHDNPRCIFFSSNGTKYVATPIMPQAERIDWPKGVEQWPLPEKQWVAIAPNAWKDFHGQTVRTPDGRLGELVGKNDTGLMVSIEDSDEETIIICKGCEVQQ
jgi:hypothetical protein